MTNITILNVLKAVAAVLIGLLSALGLVAQTKPGPKPTARIIRVESAEHAFARINLEALTRTLRESGMMIACLDPSSDLAKLYTCPENDTSIQAKLHASCPDLNKTPERGLPTPAKLCAMALVETTVSFFDEEETLKKKLAVVDRCKALYSKTIDMKTSDLTTRQIEPIAGCRTLDLYPPPTQLRIPWQILPL